MVIIEEVAEAPDYAAQINVYNQGKVSEYSKGEESFERVIACWKNTVKGSHQMPAFGVSLNRETVKAKNCGLWLEFVYDEAYECSEMTFEKLLIKVEKGQQGFNIIRYNSGYGYDGRCYYLDLINKNLDEMYDILLSL